MMTQSRHSWYWRLGSASSLAIGGVLAFANFALAQIESDTSLGAESSVIKRNLVIRNLPSDRIDGGARRGANLFHSFQEFNLDEGRGAYFTSPPGVMNILSRVTGSDHSDIQGTLGVLGNANLFLLNPKGIIFGKNASLDVNGSFVASTASSLKFVDGIEFSAANPQTLPILKVSAPTGLQFGATPESIVNRSQAGPDGAVNSFGSPVGLQVQTGKTLALVGGNVMLEGGNLAAAAGRIEIGSVAGFSLVSLTPADQGWALGYEGIQSFQDVQLSQQAIVDTSGEGGGDIQIQGERVKLTDASQILAETQGAKNAGDITVSTEKLIVRGGSQISTVSSGVFLPESSKFIPATGKGGDLTVNASESVELTGTLFDEFSGLVSATYANGDAGDITINTRRLIAHAGGTIATEASGVSLPEQFIPATGRAGNLTVNASESVELTGTSPSGVFSRLSSATIADPGAGDVTINTRRLLVQGGAAVSTTTFGRGRAGNLNVTAPESVELIGTSTDGENLSSLIAIADSEDLLPIEVTGQGGDLTIATGRFLVRDKAQATVSSEGRGDAGDLRVTARSVLLNNEGNLAATTASGKGGNIIINTDTLVGIENSNILANANRGEGGFIDITAQGIFGLEVRDPTNDINELRNNNTSDISASSLEDPSLNGVVQINTPDVDPNEGVVALPEQVVDVSGLVAQSCPAGGGAIARARSNRSSGQAQSTQASQNEFVTTGRGGLPPTPKEALKSDTVLVDLGTPMVSAAKPSKPLSASTGSSGHAAPGEPLRRASSHSERDANSASSDLTHSAASTITEAQGWVRDPKGQIVLTAQATASRHSELTAAACHGF